MTSSIVKWIIDHRKFFIAVWFVITVVMISPAVSSFDMIDSTLQNMDDRTTANEEYVRQYFDGSDLDNTRMPMVVIGYWNSEGLRQISGDISLEPLSEYIKDRFRTDEKWSSEIDLYKGGVVDVAVNGSTDKGAIVLGIIFNDDVTDEEIYNYTDALRSSVDQYKNDYMFELYEDKTYFDVYLTGNTVILNDVDDEFNKYLIISVVAVSVFVLLMMGLFFGSVATSLISAASMASSAVITLAMMYLITARFSIPYIVMILVLVLVMVLSFAHSILTFSFYRNELLNGNDKSTALLDVLRRTSRVFIPFIVCLAICCIVLMFTNVQLIFIFGFCLLVGLIILGLISSTLPISLINLTKNELLWRRNDQGLAKWKPIRKIYSAIDLMFLKITEITSGHSIRSLITVCVAIVVLISGSAAYIVANNSFSNVSYDTINTLSSGDSREALNTLKDNSMAGICQPYQIEIDYGHPIAHIIRDDIKEMVDGELTYRMYLYWDDYSYYNEIRDLESRLSSSFSDGVFSVASMECWDVLVQEEKKIHPSASGQTLIDNVVSSLSARNMAASTALVWVLEDLESEGLSADYIINYCGARIDYRMNHSTGTFGYHMVSSGEIVVDHIMIDVIMSDTATSSEAMDTANKMESAVNGFISDSANMTDYRTLGMTATYKDVTKDVESRAPLISVIICILLILAAALFERKLIFTITGVVLTAAGFVISAGITFMISDLLHLGDVYFLLPFMMFFTTIVTCTWFGFMQCSEARYSDDIRTMKRCVDPIIIITSGSIIIFAIIMAFTDISFIYQSALMLVVSMLIQGLIMRIVISPHLWVLVRTDTKSIKLGRE